MALIGKIRNNSWLLVVLIGLGLGGFIFMDMTSGQQSIFGGQSTSMGKVAGQSIDYNQFARTESALYAGSSSDIFSRRATLWNYYVENAIVNKESKDLGIVLTNEEFNELQFGANPSPIIQGAFANAQGQLDRAQLNQIKQAVETNQLNQKFREYWIAMRDQVKKNGLETKLNNLVSKSLYVPTWMVEDFHKEQNDKVEFNYVRIPYDSVDDSAISISDADYTNYMNENKGTYYNDEETRRLSYVTFDVKATPQDSAELRTKLTNMVAEFETTEDDSVFVTSRLGFYDNVYAKNRDVFSGIADIVFDAPVGTVHGPYQDGAEYKIVKLLDRKVIPDSVRARHILLKYTDVNGYNAAQIKADSLIAVAKSGVTPFDTLTKRFSQDFSNNTKGGDLGYVGPGAFVKPFNDMVFYTANKGEFRKVDSQFGTHIVQVMNYKYTDREEGVRLAYISEPIIPSSNTQQTMYTKVVEFSGKNSNIGAMQTAAEAEGLEVVVSPALKVNDYLVGVLGGGQPSRSMVKFAFSSNTSVGDVSAPVYTYTDPTYNYSSKYVVAALNSIIPEGMPSVASMKDELQTLVMNRAKGESIKSAINATDLSSLASTYDSSVDTVRAVAFSATFQPGLGNEPKVIATAFNTEIGAMSTPVIGNSGVFVLTPTAKTPAPNGPSVPVLRNQLRQQSSSQVTSRLMESARKAADLSDKRATFF